MLLLHAGETGEALAAVTLLVSTDRRRFRSTFCSATKKMLSFKYEYGRKDICVQTLSKLKQIINVTQRSCRSH